MAAPVAPQWRPTLPTSTRMEKLRTGELLSDLDFNPSDIRTPRKTPTPQKTHCHVGMPQSWSPLWTPRLVSGSPAATKMVLKADNSWRKDIATTDTPRESDWAPRRQALRSKIPQDTDVSVPRLAIAPSRGGRKDSTSDNGQHIVDSAKTELRSARTPRNVRTPRGAGKSILSSRRTWAPKKPIDDTIPHETTKQCKGVVDCGKDAFNGDDVTKCDEFPNGSAIGCKEASDKVNVDSKRSEQHKARKPSVPPQYFNISAMDPDSEEETFFPEHVSEVKITLKREYFDISTTDSDSDDDTFFPDVMSAGLVVNKSSVDVPIET